MVDDIAPKLISIESVRWSAYGPVSQQTNCWKVTMGCDDGRGNKILETTFHLEKKDFADDQALAVARNYVARLCQDIADQTKAWVMSDEQWEAAKIGARAKPVATDASEPT